MRRSARERSDRNERHLVDTSLCERQGASRRYFRENVDAGKLIFSFAATLTLLLLNSIAAGVEFHVSPSGSDDATGTRQAPFATLVRARDAVRALDNRGDLAQPVRVIVADGRYILTEPLVLESQDSGTAQAPVVYQAADGARPVFSGGRVIGGWEPAGNGIWKTSLPEVASGSWYFEQLFVNGRRAVRARTPNKFYFYMQDVREERIGAGGGSRPSRAKQIVRMRSSDFAVLADLNVQQLKDVNLVAYHKWDNTRRFVDRLDANEKTLITSGMGMKPWNPWKKDTRFHLENFLGALDIAGEFFLDRDGTLYYKPRPDEDLTTAEVVAPVVDQFLTIQGDAAAEELVQHVTFRGLTFLHAQWLTPPGGFEPAQAASPVDAVVTIDGSRYVSIEDCRIGHVGTYVVWFRKGCQDCTLQRCYLYDFGAGGVRIGESGIASNVRERTSRIQVDNNIICHGGRIFPCAVGIWIGQSGENRVTHNEIADLFYTGISVGWRWGYSDSLAKRNTIDSNRVHHLGWGVLSDMGGIYTLGPSEGTVVTNNVFHDIYAYSYGGWGLYTDEGSTGILFENNLVYRVKTGGFHQHYGRENIVRNNILAYSKLYQIQATRVEDHLSFTLENNIVYYDTGVLLSGRWDQVQHVSRKNCYWNAAGEQVQFLNKSLKEWQAAGHEEGSLIADPKFIDPENGDFRLAADSPALKLGFKPFNDSQAGVYGDPEWIQQANTGVYPPLEIAPDPPAVAIGDDS